ncbi:MAG: LysR family transcriptional regulator [Salibaculum sp.]|uniref:LysR family transcriptional regulator n=1 Tax=Salibaculum sp. TaxID=2855480 RepID=UPI002870340D|nr:LysR family transcriptional regulator [Salibaculum sp.]MDR9428247.1 LysR family transcriptional regulator [Salibaculum sp.]
MRVDLRQLEMLDALATHGSLTKAADAIHVTQPAISSQMRKLEEHVGLPLYERDGRGVRLTEVGDRVVHHARRVGRVMGDLQQDLRHFKNLDRGEVTLAVVSTANHFIPEDIVRFRKAHPGVEINLRVANRDTILEILAANETDLAITGQPPDDADVVARPFKENPLVVIAPPDHAMAGRDEIRPSDIAGEPFVLREYGSGTRRVMERAFLDHGLECKAACVLSSNEAVKQAVQAGLGVAIISRQTVELELETGRLVTLRCYALSLMRHWFVLYRNFRRLSPAALAFRNLLLEGRRDPQPHHAPSAGRGPA